MKKNQYVRLLIKVLISGGLLSAIYWKTGADLTVFTGQLKDLMLWQVILGVLLFCLLILIKTIRWTFILRKAGVGVSLLESYQGYWAGIAAGAVTPGRLGEFMRAYLVSRRSSLTFREAFLTVLVDRLYDLFFLCAACGAALMMFVLDGGLLGWSAMTLVLLLLLWPVLKLLDAIFYKTIFRKNGTDDSRSVKLLKLCRDALLLRTWNAGVFTVLAYIVYFILSYGVVRAAGVETDLWIVCAVISCAGIVVLLPVSFAGLGTREAVFVTLLAGFGVNESAALAASLLHFMLFFVVGSVIGAVFWLFLPGRSDYKREKLEAIP